MTFLVWGTVFNDVKVRSNVKARSGSWFSCALLVPFLPGAYKQPSLMWQNYRDQ